MTETRPAKRGRRRSRRWLAVGIWCLVLASGLLGTGATALAQSSGSTAPMPTSTANTPSLTQAPPVSLGQGSKAVRHTSKSAAPAADPPAANLPRTGLDTGGIALLGVGLLLVGVGLRLCTRDVGWT